MKFILEKVLWLTINWYLKTFKGLSLSELYNKIVNMTDVEVFELRTLKNDDKDKYEKNKYKIF